MRKKFDSVAFQRKMRAKLSKEYTKSRAAFLKELKIVAVSTVRQGAVSTTS